MPNFALHRSAFRRLHAAGCFVIPNPWDIGTACYLRRLGFRALATTSAGFGFSRGLPDSALALPRDLVLNHIAEIVVAADLPVNADFQSGYAPDPAGVAHSVRLCIDTGVAGLSIEDATGDPARPLYEVQEALDRLCAARAAIDSSGAAVGSSRAAIDRSGDSGADVLLTARAECFLVGHPDPLRESIRRLQAYAEAGADVLFAPGVRERDDIRAIVSSVSPKPVNVLMSANTGLNVSDLADLGVRRVSVGSALARAAWSGFLQAVRPIAEFGSFAGLEGLVPFAELNSAFQEDSRGRSS